MRWSKSGLARCPCPQYVSKEIGKKLIALPRQNTARNGPVCLRQFSYILISHCTKQSFIHLAFRSHKRFRVSFDFSYQSLELRFGQSQSLRTKRDSNKRCVEELQRRPGPRSLVGLAPTRFRDTLKPRYCLGMRLSKLFRVTRLKHLVHKRLLIRVSHESCPSNAPILRLLREDFRPISKREHFEHLCTGSHEQKVSKTCTVRTDDNISTVDESCLLS
mmetsp:Transcript_5691/g.11978  ORF Transcript_5691/g.11978 Transcript_5691/m.11978 type:complete len:218 (-) Transcript_5691:420-1073(-)